MSQYYQVLTTISVQVQTQLWHAQYKQGVKYENTWTKVANGTTIIVWCHNFHFQLPVALDCIFEQMLAGPGG